MQFDKQQQYFEACQDALACLAMFDNACPGRGLDAHSADQLSNHSMAYALFASAAAAMRMEPEAINAVDWLIADAFKPNGEIGWGLSFEWDAFADGSVNPVHTIYGISTALGVRALLDVYESFRWAAVKQTVIGSLETYRKYIVRTNAGLFFWYSNQEQDAKSVHNVTAMLAAQYARAGRLFGRDDFIHLAEDAVNEVISHRKTCRNGTFWPYGADYDRPNDAVHAAYTVLGLLEAAQMGACSYDIRPAIQYLRKFFRAGQFFEFVRHDNLTRSQHKRLGRQWGAGALLLVGCEAGDRYIIEEASRFAKETLHVRNDGKVYPRQLAHVALGLAWRAKYYGGLADIEGRRTKMVGERRNVETKHVVSLVANGVRGDSRVIKTAKAAQAAGYRATIVGIGRSDAVERIEIDGAQVVLVPSIVPSLLEEGLWPKDKSKRELWPLVEGALQRMLPVVADLQPTILHSHDMLGLRIGSAISRYLAANGHFVPWVHDLHEFVVGLTTVPESYRRASMEYERRYLRQADHLITVSEKLADQVREIYHLRSTPSVVFNAPESRPDFDADKADVRSAIGLSADAKLVVYIGVAKKERGCETIVSAVAALQDVHICFVSDSAYVTSLRERAEQLGMASRFHSVPYVPSDEVTAFIRTADVGTHGLIHYPNGEVAMPNKLFEYLHAGIPMVVSDVAEMKRFIEHTGVGEVFEAENEISCAHALQAVLNNRSNYASRITAELKENYSWQAQSRKLSSIYSNLTKIADQRANRILLVTAQGGGASVELRKRLLKLGYDVDVAAVCNTEPRADVDLYIDPTTHGDQAGILSRVIAKYGIVHLCSDVAGWPSEVDIIALRDSGLKVIEDDYTTVLLSSDTDLKTFYRHTTKEQNLSIAVAIEKERLVADNHAGALLWEIRKGSLKNIAQPSNEEMAAQLLAAQKKIKKLSNLVKQQREELGRIDATRKNQVHFVARVLSKAKAGLGTLISASKSHSG